MSFKYFSIVPFLFACGSYEGAEYQTIQQEQMSAPFYGVRNDGANAARLCAGAPSSVQQCLLPANQRIRVRLKTTGMNAAHAALATQWVTAIIDNTFNKESGVYFATGFSWLQTIHQPKITIVKGAVDDSLGADATDIRRYLRMKCEVIGTAMIETPAKNGTYHACNFWTATLDTDKLSALDDTKMSFRIHQAVAVAMLAPAGISVGNITPGKVTSQTIASTFFLSTTVSDRDLCGMTVFDPTDLSSVNFVSDCE